jgi:hypothetical protein
MVDNPSLRRKVRYVTSLPFIRLHQQSFNCYPSERLDLADLWVRADAIICVEYAGSGSRLLLAGGQAVIVDESVVEVFASLNPPPKQSEPPR